MQSSLHRHALGEVAGLVHIAAAGDGDVVRDQHHREVVGRLEPRHQLEQAHRFRYMVRNDDVERAAAELGAYLG